MIEHTDPQGSDAWHESRRGVKTASRAKDMRDRSDGLEKKQRVYVEAILKGRSEAQALALSGYKKPPTSELVKRALAGEKLPMVWGAAAISYAQDLARERCGGGRVISKFEGLSQRLGHEEEPFAAIAWVAETGIEAIEVGFITTDDNLVGMSLDRRVPSDNGALEIKTMVSSATLFKAVVEGDISEYRDQCVFGLWMLGLDWIDLCLWAPDLSQRPLHVVRITRDEEEIQALEDDVVAFERLVAEYVAKLEARLVGAVPSAIEGDPAATPDDTPRRTEAPAPSAAPSPVPAARVASTAPAIPEFEF